MATRLPARDDPAYEVDPYAWAKEQAGLLRARRFEALDLARLAEEVEELAGTLHRSVRSRIRTIVEHLLKLEYPRPTSPGPSGGAPCGRNATISATP